MRITLLITLIAVFSGCSDDPRPVFGSGVWRFHNASGFDRSCGVDERDRSVTGEHGDEGPSGGTLVVRCRATTLSNGDLSFNLTLEDPAAGDMIDLRALRIPSVYLSETSPFNAVPSGCESVYFEVGGARYQAVCTTGEPQPGDCRLEGATLDESASSISLDLSCHGVPTLGGGGSTCEVSGPGTTAIATVSFDGCTGF